MAFFLAVQTAISAAASCTEDIFSIYSQNKISFFEDLEFGDNDWAALCHIRLHGTNGAERYLDSVETAADQLMDTEGFVKPTELQRAAVILAAAGRCSEELINAAVYNNDKLERQGMNAYVWGVIAANCSGIEAPDNALNTVDMLTEYLLSKQLADGGFSLKGSLADTDMTASVIYALAPLKDDEKVNEALAKAEQCLRNLQLNSGGFSSMDIENCESSAQALVAFAALGYGREDEQVSKALEAMLSYRRENGYAHLPEGEANGIATVQALLALTALELSENGGLLYDYCDTEHNPVATTPSSTSEQPSFTVQTEEIMADITEDVPAALTGDAIRLIIGGTLMVTGVISAIALMICGRKKLLAIPVVLLVAGAVVLLLDIRTPEEYYASEHSSGGITVTVTVDHSAVLGYELPVDLPESGMMLSEYTVSITEESSAFDALIAAAKAQQLQVDHTGSAFGEYVRGIGGLYEFDCGSESGWLYNVNGEHPSVSAGAYSLSDGDEILFIYTCTLGTYQR